MEESHLYTIWNPKHEADTIGAHRKLIRKQGFVKWLILYDEKSGDEYKEILSNDDIEKINAQAREKETVLYIQCLNIFHSPLYAGRIVEVGREVELSSIAQDPQVPSYYKDAMEQQNLRAFYSIKLCHLKQIDLDVILNLDPDATFRSEKFNYPFPCPVIQKKPRLLFTEDEEFENLVINHGYLEEHGGSTYYVESPLSKTGRTLTLGKIETALISLFQDNRRKAAKSILKELNESTGTDIDGKTLTAKIGQINKKFKECYSGRKLFVSSGKSTKSGTKYMIQSDHVLVKGIHK